MKGEKIMKCLEIKNGKGYFRTVEKDFQEIDKIGKDDILSLLDIATDAETSFEMDDVNNNEINNPAHKIIYQHLFEKFNDILQNKNRFLDESNAKYKDALQKYHTDL